MNKIILSADSTCDLDDNFVEKYNIIKYPYTINLGDKTYKDNVDITPNEIFDIYEKDKILPKTSTINVAEYYTYFKPFVEDGYEIIHINLGGALTSAYNNARLAAIDLGNVYTVDSQSLSTGSGLLVLKAVKLIEEGLDAKTIKEKLEDHKENIHVSFILDTLKYLEAGGRCSKVASFGSNLLKIKPEIKVDNTCGSMSVGKKYKGPLQKSIKKYTKDKLSSYDNIDKECIFITHSGVDEEYIQIAKETIMEIVDFENIYVTTASCTISSHCGPNTLGLAFQTQ